MTLDPRIAMYLNIAVIALGAIATYLASDTQFMHSPAGVYTLVGIGAGVAAINAILHAVPSKPGATEQFPLGPKT